MTTAVLTSGARKAEEVRLPLATELAARGITMIPKGIVHAHMRKVINKHRVGIYKLIGPLLYRLVNLTNFLFGTINGWATILLVLVTFIVSGIAMLCGLPYTSIVFFPSFIVGAGIIIDGVIMYFVEEKLKTNAPLQRASMIWIREKMDTTRSMLLEFGVPERLHDRVRRTSKIDDVVINRLRFGSDPIIEVLRPRGFLFLNERVYIGGWATGDSNIDDI